jgi:hypothetical protein
MTLPRGYKPPEKKKIADNNDFGDNNKDITNKKENSLTNEILQSITIDDTIKEVLETSKEVVSNVEDTVKEVIEKGKDAIVGDSSIMDKSIRYEDQDDRSQLTQENKMNNNKNYNYNDNSNLRISTDKSSSKKEELTTTIPASTREEEREKEETKIIQNNKEKEQHENQESSFKTITTVPIEEEEEGVNVEAKTELIVPLKNQQEETTNNINNNSNEYQNTNRAIFDKNIDTANRYQQQTVDTVQSILNNYVELQKNIANTFQSAFSRFLDNTSKSYWNNFQYPQRYTDTYKNTNQTITENTTNCTQRMNDFALASIESFNKVIEIAQRYYNESIQNYLEFINKVGRS